MKKIWYFIAITLVCLTASIIFLMSDQSPFYKKKSFYIAMVGPMSGSSRSHGIRMIQGINLFLDEFNKKNKDHIIELLVFDDKNDKREAVKIASELITNQNILLVLGHYGSDPSFAAGSVYKKIGMPVITASATADVVLENNEWYFRTVSANGFAAQFIANYIYRSLNQDKASIIFDEDNYGVSLMTAFEKTAEHLGIKIEKKWGINTTDQSVDMNIKRIIDEIRATDETGMLFIALHGLEAAKLVASLKYPGTHYQIIGADALSSEIYIDYFKREPIEKNVPGYHSDDVYAISHLIFDISNEKAYEFQKKFISKYHTQPSWVSSTYYDAAHLAAEVIERAEIQDIKDIRTCRKYIREALTKVNSPETSILGVCGPTYFNSAGEVSKSLPMGVYKKQQLVPAFSQYQIVSEADNTTNDQSSQDIITIGDKKMRSFRIVYTGIDINEINDSDMLLSTCTIDFYIWFRFAGDFDDKNVEFVNAVNPITLQNPILESTTDNITVRAYHVKGTFKINFDFHRYPFNRQTIRIMIRNLTIPKSKLIYVADKIGMPELETIKINIERQKTLNKWDIKDISFYQDTVQKFYTSGNTPKNFKELNVDYSQINTVIQMEQKGSPTIFKNFFPILSAVIMLYSSYFLPINWLAVRIVLSLASMLMCGIYHMLLNVTLSVKYMLFIEYSFFAFYSLVIISLLFFFLIEKALKKNATNKIKYLNYMLKILYPPIVLVIGISMANILSN